MSELDKLEQYLKDTGANFKRIDTSSPSDGFGARHQIIVMDDSGKTIWDAICHWGSYGWREGLLEIMGNIVDEERVGDRVEGWLTAQDVIDRIEGRA